jgi:DedD protein
LKTSGYSVGEEKITLEGNKAVRLRVGPFQNKTAALKARADIQNDLGVQGVVLANP